MLAATVHMMRGTPYIYQGEEIGMLNAHFNDISKYRDVESLNYYQILLKDGKTKEEALKTLSECSRDNSRTPMQWSDEENAGFSSVTPWISVPDHYKQTNVKKELEDKDSIYYFYKKLIDLRKESDFRRNHCFEKEDLDILAYKRVYKEECLIVLNNMMEKEKEVEIEEWVAYHKLLENYDAEKIVENKIILRPFETLVLEK